MGPLSPPFASFGGPRNGDLSSECMEGIPETTVESLVHKCLFDSDKGAQVWKKRRTVAPDPGKNCYEDAMATLRCQVEQCRLEFTFWNELALAKDEEIKNLNVELEEVRGELQRLENLKCLQTEKWRKEAKTLALELKVMNREIESLRTNSEAENWRDEATRLAIELDLKSREKVALRDNAKRDKLRMEEAHKQEFETLRLKARRVVERLKAAFENHRTALADAESTENEPVGSTGGSEQNKAVALLMDPQSKKRRAFFKDMEEYFDTMFKRREFLEAVEQYYDAKFKATRIGEGGKNYASNVTLDPLSEGTI